MGRKERNRLQQKKNNHLTPAAEESLENAHQVDKQADKRKPTQNHQ
ncbi:hypothetical protein [Bacillus solimangrovi]|nr:hypothetical protein [Bacillus solimangrovi]